MARGEQSGGTAIRPGADPWASLTAGYRFFLVDDPTSAREALDVRLDVYTQKVGRAIEVPDVLDERAWLLAAEHLESGRIVGTMRVAPRDHGPFECERFFDVPVRLRHELSVEITRFAVLPSHRKKPDSLPAVSLGLFRLSTDLCRRLRTSWVVIASRTEQIETYRWLGFEQTGVVSSYGSLGGAPHELLWHDFPRLGGFEWHAMYEFFGARARAEIQLPDVLPEPGAWLRPLRRSRVAVAGSTS